MFALYEYGQPLSRKFSAIAARFFVTNRQTPRGTGEAVYIIYVAM